MGGAVGGEPGPRPRLIFRSRGEAEAAGVGICAVAGLERIVGVLGVAI